MLRRFAPILLVALLGVAACGPPAPPGSYRGDECPWSVEIQEAWAGTGDEHWAVDTAIRESRCQEGARNPSGASGIFQMMMPLHARLVRDVCGFDGVFDARCNITAARALYDGAGRGPWGG